MKTALYIALALLVGAACGYYLMPTKTVTQVVEKKVNRVITIVKRPDGTVEKVIKDNSVITTDTETKVKERSKLAISALAGTDLSKPIYGAAVSKEVLGPITIGIFGLSNASFGASVGLNF